jgi:putative Holliday junction resolvase
LRVLALDVGTVRIGVALSDPLGVVASPERVIECADRRRDLQRLADLVVSTGAELVVVGLPTTLRGERGPAAQEVEQFVRELADHLDIPVTTWDERMTTVVAERALLEGGQSRQSRRHLRDKVAATVLLQSYLDAHREQ